MTGNLANWQPKIIKKDKDGNYHLGKLTISASVAALVISISTVLFQWYSTLPPSAPQPAPVPTPVAPVIPFNVIAKERAAQEQATVQPQRAATQGIKSTFSAGQIYADLVVPDSKVDVYKLVRIKTTKVADFYDILVMTISNSNILFVDTVPTANTGEWVFTGPPGQYSVRLTMFGKDTGFNSATGTVTIGTPTPPVPPTPPTPPGPPVPPVPIPDGKYGLGPVSFNVASTQVPADFRKYASTVNNSLADNFESVAAAIAAGSFTTADAANKELAGKNRFTLSDPAALNAWMPFFNAWTAKVTDLNKAGKLPNIASEYAVAYKETAVGLRGVK